MISLRFPRFTALLLLAAALTAQADLIEEFRNRNSAALNEFREEKYNDLEGFRRRINEEIAQFISQPWQSVKATPEIEPPEDPSPDPVYVDMDTVKEKIPRQIIIKNIITSPKPAPRPQPLEPIVEIKPGEETSPAEETEPSVEPDPIEEGEPTVQDPTAEDPVIEANPTVRENHIDVELYGTIFKMRRPDLSNYRLRERSPGGYADAWRSLNTTATNNFIIDCLSQREERGLCDWAYIQLIQAASELICKDDRAKATLLSGFLLSQCGYRIRFATDSSNRLHLLYSPTGIVYQVPSFNIDGYNYYVATDFDRNDLNYKLCNFKCPGEKQISFEITEAMHLDYKPAPTRKMSIHNRPDIELSVSTNRNLIDFYNTYPTATAGKDTYTQWAIYANTPASAEVQRDLYPPLMEAVKGLSQKDAANLLIHLAESFPYGYDSEIWGRDRAFFVDESWFYPFSDCEDHAIHFTRLVRDILGLEAVLVYYPNHLAAAVAFTEPGVEGDFVIHRGKRFTICDPTIFYADVGTTMQGCENENAVMIDLNY